MIDEMTAVFLGLRRRFVRNLLRAFNALPRRQCPKTSRQPHLRNRLNDQPAVVTF